MVGGGGRVDPHDGAVGVQRGVDQRCARRLPVLGRDTVLEVEDHDIGCRGGLFEPLGAVGRAEQPAGPGRASSAISVLLGGPLAHHGLSATRSPRRRRAGCGRCGRT